MPESSRSDPSDRGERAHTNHRILAGPKLGLGPGGGLVPSELWQWYRLGTYTLGQTAPAGHGVIAIVDAYDYPTAQNDFNVFSSAWGLPQDHSKNVNNLGNPYLTVIYQNNRRPRSGVSNGWALEEALDIQWAHAMAPTAKIVLVEAQSSSFSDLFAAIELAKSLNPAQISMSWGGSEFAGEQNYDYHFNVNGPVFFAAAGDTGAQTIYPSASPYVVAVGGTSLATDGSGDVTGETGWSDGGGGPSLVEGLPGWQSGVVPSTTARCIPDVAAVADPNTGVSVYGAYGRSYGWWIVGGTSVATPCMAGMVNLGGMTYGNTTSLLEAIYSIKNSSNFRDITSGNNGYPCTTGWDFVTGVGSPLGTGF